MLIWSPVVQVCSSPDAHVVSEDPRKESAAWKCTKCDLKRTAEEINELENKLAMDMSKIDNQSLSGFEIYLEDVTPVLHPCHYLTIMLKRHLVQLYSGVLLKLDEEDLERVKGYTEDVIAVYDVIDAGYQKERGTMLNALCEVHKILAKKYLTTGRETEEQFSVRVKKCCELFQEGQVIRGLVIW